MKKAKIKTTKPIKKTVNKAEPKETITDVKKLIILSATFLVVFMAFYFLTTAILSNKNNSNNKEKETIGREVSEETILLSQLLKQSEDKYFVLAIFEDDQMTALYDKYITLYKKTYTDAKFYYVDMGDALNKNNIGTENVITSDVRDIKIAEPTLFVVENDKIVTSVSGATSITKYFNSLTVDLDRN